MQTFEQNSPRNQNCIVYLSSLGLYKLNIMYQSERIFEKKKTNTLKIFIKSIIVHFHFQFSEKKKKKTEKKVFF